MAGLMQNVLQLYSVNTVPINGMIKVLLHNKLVQQFYNDNHPARIFMFLSIGSAGLNFTKADIIIIF
ncbi:hypothetical protein C0995_005606, partial [Termitomyces sp. Mi166